MITTIGRFTYLSFESLNTGTYVCEKKTIGELHLTPQKQKRGGWSEETRPTPNHNSDSGTHRKVGNGMHDGATERMILLKYY